MHHSPQPTENTRAQSLDAISNQSRCQRQTEVVDILTAAYRHGVMDMTVSEMADQHRINTGTYVPASGFTGAISALTAAKRICKAEPHIYAGSGRMQKAYSLVLQQARLMA